MELKRKIENYISLNWGKSAKMINITLDAALALYFIVYMGAIFILWMFLSVKGGEKVSYLSQIKIWQCSICAFIYLHKDSSLSKCPRCSSYNKLAEKERRH